MGKYITNKGREKLGLGTGEGPDYKAYIRATEVNQDGRRHRAFSPILNRLTDTLSDIESWYLAETLFNDSVIDINEQYKLDLEETIFIAKRLGIRHPYDYRAHEKKVITTDFLITTIDGRQHARTVKPEDRITDRDLLKFAIEEAYFYDREIDWAYVTEKCFNVQRGKFLKDCYFNYYLKIDERFNYLDFYLDAIATLIQRLFEDKPVKSILNEFESDYNLRKSSGINLLKHLIVRKYITLDMSNGLNMKKPLEITNTVDLYALDHQELLLPGGIENEY